MKRRLLEQLLADRAAKRPVALVTRLSSGEQWLVYADAVPDADLDAEVSAGTRRLLAENRSGLLDTAADLFVQAFNPPLRLIVVGAVHIAQALVPIARLAGYEAIVIDPRRAWATDSRFADVTIRSEWPDEAMQKLAPDHRTAVVTLSHDPKLDDPALHVALRSPAFYCGALGSKKTHAARLARLREAGFSDADFARIHAPIGLAIGAQSPAEIAISIMAQITQVLHKVNA
jgi:xanthine dehydrogenase accessory factor